MKASPSLAPSRRRRGDRIVAAVIGKTSRRVERCEVVLASGNFGRATPPSWVGVRLVGLWILLVAVYAATLGIPARTGMDYAGDEPHHLLAAESIVSDRDVDLTDEYADRAYASWYPRELRTDGAGRRRAAGGAARRRLRAADRPGLRDRRGARGAGADARAAGVRVRARRRARAADGARALRDPRRRPRRPLPARARRLDGDHARRPRRRPARGRRTVRLGRARASAPALRVRRRAAAGRAAVAGVDVRGARRRHRVGAGDVDLARAPAARRAAGG